nr:hypothetical protein [Tanacetum cinerariifolium]
MILAPKINLEILDLSSPDNPPPPPVFIYRHHNLSPQPSPPPSFMTTMCWEFSSIVGICSYRYLRMEVRSVHLEVPEHPESDSG